MCLVFFFIYYIISLQLVLYSLCYGSSSRLKPIFMGPIKQAQFYIWASYSLRTLLLKGGIHST